MDSLFNLGGLPVTSVAQGIKSVLPIGNLSVLVPRAVSWIKRGGDLLKATEKTIVPK